MVKRFSPGLGTGYFSLVLATLFLLISIAGVAVAQKEAGQISGKVVDPNGAVVPNATVTAKRTDTGAERTVQTNDSGEYIITNLQSGPYEVTATVANFQPGKVTVQLTVGAQTTADIKLGLQQVGTTVNIVAAGGIEVNTTTQEVSNVVNTTQLRELPTITRDPYSLATISANVSDVGSNDA